MEQYEYRNGPPAPRMVAELAMRHDALVRQLADAQATIAALQAVIDAHHRLVREMDVRLNGEQGAAKQASLCDIVSQLVALQARVQELEDDRSAWKEIAQDWSAAAKLAEQPEKFYEGYSAAVMNAMQALLTKARAEFTQRTAELARVRKKLVETSLYFQQERANRDYLAACVDRDVKTIKELRTLVLALPKVEGEIADETILDLWESDAITFDALRGLLQRRQGMEGQS